MSRYITINSDQELQRYCQQWQQCEVLALDTEFIRTDTFYPIAALIQVNDGSHSYLIDPLTVSDFSAFNDLLVSPAITKVLHSCSEDLEVFERLLGVIPAPLIDTQIAAAMDGLGFSLGYQRLTESLLGIQLDKGETRSNWLQRPLTDSQRHYAAQDVDHLLVMYQKLQQSLQQKGRWQWLQQDCAALVEQAAQPVDTADYYKKIKSAWKLNQPQLAVLKTVTDWREQQARKRDKPRGRILKDRSCFEIARLRPNNLEQLSSIEDIGYKTVKHRGDTLLSLIEQASEHADDNLPALLDQPLPPETRGLAKQLKQCVQQQAEQLQMAPELLAKKLDYEALLRASLDSGETCLPESLCGWRQAVVGEKLLALVKSR